MTGSEVWNITIWKIAEKWTGLCIFDFMWLSTAHKLIDAHNNEQHKKSIIEYETFILMILVKRIIILFKVIVYYCVVYV